MNKFKINPTDLFWFNLSLSAVIVSIGITWSLIRGSAIDLEANSTRFKLSGIASKNREITRELKQVSRELKQVPNNPNKIKVIKEIEQELSETELQLNQIEQDIIQDDKQDGDRTNKNNAETNNGTENN